MREHQLKTGIYEQFSNPKVDLQYKTDGFTSILGYKWF